MLLYTKKNIPSVIIYCMWMMLGGERYVPLILMKKKEIKMIVPFDFNDDLIGSKVITWVQEGLPLRVIKIQKDEAIKGEEE